MGDAGASRKRSNDAPWETLSLRLNRSISAPLLTGHLRGTCTTPDSYPGHLWGTCTTPDSYPGHLRGTCTTPDRTPAGYLHHS